MTDEGSQESLETKPRGFWLDAFVEEAQSIGSIWLAKPCYSRRPSVDLEQMLFQSGGSNGDGNKFGELCHFRGGMDTGPDPGMALCDVLSPKSHGFYCCWFFEKKLEGFEQTPVQPLLLAQIDLSRRIVHCLLCLAHRRSGKDVRGPVMADLGAELTVGAEESCLDYGQVQSACLS